MKKFLFYAIFIVFASQVLNAQTESNKKENITPLNHKDEKNSNKGTPYWTLINRTDLFYGAGKVGIGTQSPQSALDVSGTITTTGFVFPGGNTGDVLTYSNTGTAYWTAPSSGGGGGETSPWISVSKGIAYHPGGANTNVGIGINNPITKLDVNGIIKTNAEYTFDPLNDGIISFGSSIEGRKLKIVSNYRDGLKSGINGISITSVGNVGIGIDNPYSKLEVDGKTKTETLQISGGVCDTDYVLTAIDANGNARWASLETGGESNAWDEDENGNVFLENGYLGIGTTNPSAPLDLNFGHQTIGLIFTGVNYGSSTIYPDFNIETNYNNSKPELIFKTAKHQARYIWACGGVEKMTLSMVSYNDPGATKLTLHDGTVITNKLETETIKIGTSDNINGYTLQADIHGESKWVDLWRRTNDDVIRCSGAVGIGTSFVGDHQLVVNGSINAKEILVTETVPGSDYVFEKDYVLMPLTELEKFVNKQKHLPEVMSAKEFAENGYSLGEMDDILLRKVEELTLYMIQQQKEIDSLKTDLENFKK